MVKDDKQYLGNHKPIITKKLFDSVDEVLNNKAHIKRQKLYFAYRGVLRCNDCGCVLTASKKKGRLVYYYCTNGKGKCNEHKSYLTENLVSEELTAMFDKVIFNEKMIKMCFKAKKEKLGEQDEYFNKARNNLDNLLKKAENRKNALLDLYLDGNLTKNIYDQKSINLDNEIVQIKKDLDELKAKKQHNSEITLERIKNIFLFPIKAKKEFLNVNDKKREKIVKTLLWNAEVKNKKIANFSFKEPYDLLSKVSDKSDFLLMRGVCNVIRTRIG